MGKMSHVPPKRGHAAPPGTGPAGETCKSCRYYLRVPYHDKVWLKCKMSIHRWTHGAGSDIRASDPACRCWENGASDGRSAT
jgi:hypothetical protein